MNDTPVPFSIKEGILMLIKIPNNEFAYMR